MLGVLEHGSGVLHAQLATAVQKATTIPPPACSAASTTHTQQLASAKRARLGKSLAMTALAAPAVRTDMLGMTARAHSASLVRRRTMHRSAVLRVEQGGQA